jgi:hypothetical protein
LFGKGIALPNRLPYHFRNCMICGFATIPSLVTPREVLNRE